MIEQGKMNKGQVEPRESVNQLLNLFLYLWQVEVDGEEEEGEEECEDDKDGEEEKKKKKVKKMMMMKNGREFG